MLKIIFSQKSCHQNLVNFGYHPSFTDDIFLNELRDSERLSKILKIVVLKYHFSLKNI